MVIYGPSRVVKCEKRTFGWFRRGHPKLGSPVPVPPQHENEPWFFSPENLARELTREMAEEALLSPEVPDGAFLVRQKAHDDFAISFRLERVPGRDWQRNKKIN